MAGMTIFDASILIAHLSSSDPHSADARKIVSSPGRRAASTLTLAETLAYPASKGRLTEAQHDLRLLEIDEVAIRPGAGPQLARLRAETGLPLPDCCALHAAESTGADAIATRDSRLREVAAARGYETP